MLKIILSVAVGAVTVVGLVCTAAITMKAGVAVGAVAAMCWHNFITQAADAVNNMA